jgi:hypothetical protein
VWHYEQPLSSAAQAAYRQQQRETIVHTVRRYNAHIPIVQNLDFGHTDPQIVLPSGQQARVLTAEKRIFFILLEEFTSRCRRNIEVLIWSIRLREGPSSRHYTEAGRSKQLLSGYAFW